MNKIKSITIYIILFTVVLLLGWDVVAIHKGGTEASISSILITFAYKMPFFVFLFGIVCGHLFWRMKSNKDTVVIDQLK